MTVGVTNLQAPWSASFQGITSGKRRVKHFDNAVSAITVDALINAEAIANNTAQAAVNLKPYRCC